MSTDKRYFPGIPTRMLLKESKAGNPMVQVPIECVDGETRFFNHVLKTDTWCVEKLRKVLPRLFDYDFTECSPAEIERAIASNAKAKPVCVVEHDIEGKEYPNIYINEASDGDIVKLKGLAHSPF